MNINWVTLHVNDLPAAKEFFGDWLGLEAEPEFSPAPGLTIAFFTAANGVKIELIHDGQQRELPADSGVSIGVTSADYDRLLAEARQRGLLRGEPMLLGGRHECFFVNAPAAVAIQIGQA